MRTAAGTTKAKKAHLQEAAHEYPLPGKTSAASAGASEWAVADAANPALDAVATILTGQFQSAFATAAKLGLPPRKILQWVSAAALPFVEAELQDAYATPAEGLQTLLTAEGGCVDVARARFLFNPLKGVSRQTISEKIRDRELIAYRTGGDRWFLPVWQFRPEGGLLKGLPEVLTRIHERMPQAGELFPFTFFLQADPVIGGRTPLEALKAGELESVLEAIDGFAG